MNFVNKVKIYHGSPYLFEAFNQDGLGFNKDTTSNMAITAGFYFTTDKNEALGYAQSGYLYETELAFDLNYKANKDPELILDNKGEPNHGMRFVSLTWDNEIEKDLHKNITASQIKAILKKNPDWQEKILDYYDVNLNNRFEVDRALSKIAQSYSDTCKNNLLRGLNYLGNDWFEGKDLTYILNQEFSKRTNILAFDKTQGVDANGEPITHFCFLDGSLIPKFKVHDLSLDQSLESDLDSEIEKTLKESKPKPQKPSL